MVSTRVESIERTRLVGRPEPDFDDVAALELIAAKRLRVALALTAAMLVDLLRLHPADRVRQGPLLATGSRRAQRRHPARRARHRLVVGARPGSTSAGPTGSTTPAIARAAESGHDDRGASNRPASRTRSRSRSSSSSSRSRSASRAGRRGARAATEHFFAAGRSDHRLAERLRARRRLHERGELPRHRRPRRDCRASTA